MPAISLQVEGIHRFDRPILNEIRNTASDYFCFPFEGSPENVQENYALYPKQHEITPEFLERHFFIHKDALGAERSQYQITYRGGGDFGDSLSLHAAIRALSNKRVEIFRNYPVLRSIVHVFRIIKS